MIIKLNLKKEFFQKILLNLFKTKINALLFDRAYYALNNQVLSFSSKLKVNEMEKNMQAYIHVYLSFTYFSSLNQHFIALKQRIVNN